jgi:hypothetical protein
VTSVRQIRQFTPPARLRASRRPSSGVDP